MFLRLNFHKNEYFELSKFTYLGEPRHRFIRMDFWVPQFALLVSECPSSSRYILHSDLLSYQFGLLITAEWFFKKMGKDTYDENLQ